MGKIYAKGGHEDFWAQYCIKNEYERNGSVPLHYWIFSCFIKLFLICMSVVSDTELSRGKRIEGVPQMWTCFERDAPQTLANEGSEAIDTNVDKDTNVAPL